MNNNLQNNLQFLFENAFECKIIIQPEFPFDEDTTEIVLVQNFETTLTNTFSQLVSLENVGRCEFANLCTAVFQIMTPYTNSLLSQYRHIDAILFWRKIEKITLEWENGKNTLHKGALYGFLGKTYLTIGDLEKGFTYFSNALDADYALEGICEGYPEKAPSYLTLSLSDDPNNFMLNFTKKIRQWLLRYLQPHFDLQSLDKLFLQDKELKDIKLFFVWSVWSIFENMKLLSYLKKNSFNNLRNIECLFNLCLVIESLLVHFIADNKRDPGTKHNYNTLGILLRVFVDRNEKLGTDYGELKKSKDGELPDVIDDVLTDATRLLEARYLFVAYLIRNYGGHNLVPLEVFDTKFDVMLGILLFDILFILDQCKK